MSAEEKPTPVQPEILPPEEEASLQELAITNPKLARSFRNIQEEIKRREAANPSPPVVVEKPAKPPVTAKIIQLPLFPHEHVGTPDCFLRSSVFAGTDRGREYVKNAPVKALAGYDLKFTGEQLTQHHLVVWEALMKLANQHPLVTNACFQSMRF